MNNAPCPNCYGGHYRPCHVCGDTGRVVITISALGTGPGLPASQLPSSSSHLPDSHTPNPQLET